MCVSSESRTWRTSSRIIVNLLYERLDCVRWIVTLRKCVWLQSVACALITVASGVTVALPQLVTMNYVYKRIAEGFGCRDVILLAM